MKFNKAKCQILYLRLDNPGYTYRLGEERLEPHGKGSGAWVDHELHVSQQHALAARMADRTPGCTGHGTASQSREGTGSTVVQPHLAYCEQFGQHSIRT